MTPDLLRPNQRGEEVGNETGEGGVGECARLHLGTDVVVIDETAQCVKGIVPLDHYREIFARISGDVGLLLWQPKSGRGAPGGWLRVGSSDLR